MMTFFFLRVFLFSSSWILLLLLLLIAKYYYHCAVILISAVRFINKILIIYTFFLQMIASSTFKICFVYVICLDMMILTRIILFMISLL